jgi:hypothetical protein
MKELFNFLRFLRAAVWGYRRAQQHPDHQSYSVVRWPGAPPHIAIYIALDRNAWRATDFAMRVKLASDNPNDWTTEQMRPIL